MYKYVKKARPPKLSGTQRVKLAVAEAIRLGADPKSQRSIVNTIKQHGLLGRWNPPLGLIFREQSKYIR